MDNFGLWSIVPPLLTITLALIFKNVIVALILGILSGALIVVQGNFLLAYTNMIDMIAKSLVDDWNIRILLFCALLGGLVAILNYSGAARAFGEWAAKGLKTRRGTLFFTFFFGIIIFIDDYFNSLSVGTAMRPVADRMKVSRAKLSYILDSTAAPICIIAPISSWVVTVMSYIKDTKEFGTLNITPFEYFIRMIPFNLYVFATLAMVVIACLSKFDFGPMAESERRALSGEGLFDEERYGKNTVEEMPDNGGKAHPMDMVVTLVTLIIVSILAFPATTYHQAVDKELVVKVEAIRADALAKAEVAAKAAPTEAAAKEILVAARNTDPAAALIAQNAAEGKYISVCDAAKGMSLKDAFCNTDASYALFYAIMVTLLIVFFYFLGRRKMTHHQLSDALVTGIRAMVPALVILTLAWTIGTVIKSSPADGGVGLANYLAKTVTDWQLPFQSVPVACFVLSCLIAFATGTSWGTMGIMIPLAMPIAFATAQISGYTDVMQPSMMVMAATVGGAVFGDHASPISDTTILSATGGGAPLLEHVATQFPYACFCAFCAGISFYVTGFFASASWAVYGAWAIAAACFVIGLPLLRKFFSCKQCLKSKA